MSLIRCPECNKEISDKADVCVNCGYKLKNDSKNKKSDIIKIIIPIFIIPILYKLTFKLILFLLHLFDADTSNHFIGNIIYPMLHIGGIVLIYYILYKKIMKINKPLIPLFVIALISIFIMFQNVVNLKNPNETPNDINNNATSSENTNITSCSENGYFIQKIQGEIYSYYGHYESVIIKKCNTYKVHEDKIEASCDFKFRTTKNQSYQESSMSRSYSCKN